MSGRVPRGDGPGFEIRRDEGRLAIRLRRRLAAPGRPVTSVNHTAFNVPLGYDVIGYVGQHCV